MKKALKQQILRTLQSYLKPEIITKVTEIEDGFVISVRDKNGDQPDHMPYFAGGEGITYYDTKSKTGRRKLKAGKIIYSRAVQSNTYKTDADDDADDADTEEEPEKTSGGGESEHAGFNNRLPYGLCKGAGVKLPEGTTYSEAWKALKDKTGISEEDALKELQDTGHVTINGRNSGDAPKETEESNPDAGANPVINGQQSEETKQEETPQETKQENCQPKTIKDAWDVLQDINGVARENKHSAGYLDKVKAQIDSVNKFCSDDLARIISSIKTKDEIKKLHKTFELMKASLTAIEHDVWKVDTRNELYNPVNECRRNVDNLQDALWRLKCFDAPEDSIMMETTLYGNATEASLWDLFTQRSERARSDLDRIKSYLNGINGVDTSGIYKAIADCADSVFMPETRYYYSFGMLKLAEKEEKDAVEKGDQEAANNARAKQTTLAKDLQRYSPELEESRKKAEEEYDTYCRQTETHSKDLNDMEAALSKKPSKKKLKEIKAKAQEEEEYWQNVIKQCFTKQPDKMGDYYHQKMIDEAKENQKKARSVFVKANNPGLGKEYKRGSILEKYGVKQSDTNYGCCHPQESFTKERKNNAVWIKSDHEDEYEAIDQTKMYFEYDLDNIYYDMDETVMQAITDYTAGSSHFNAVLEGYQNTNGNWTDFVGIGNVVMDDETIQDINNLTEACESYSFKDDMWLVHGANESQVAQMLGLPEGCGFKDITDDVLNNLLNDNPLYYPAFMSCGAARNTGFDRNIMFNIYCPKGTKGIYASPVSAYGGDVYNDNGTIRPCYGENDMWDLSYEENEVLLQRGSVLKLTKFERGADGTLYLDFDLVAQEPYDLTPQEGSGEENE